MPLFFDHVQGLIKQKLKKLEGFTGINTSQLLEVATKVFVAQDQEIKQEVNRKIKKQVDTLAADFVTWSSGPQWAGLSRGRGNRHGLWPVSPRCPHPRKQLG
jgi:hypothetical protein